MGCFLGCFGFSSKRKRRKPASRVQPGDQRFGSYEPLDSASANLDIREKPIILDSQLNKKSKETLNCKIRKKVSFNLNVQTYEPIPKEEESNDFWESDDEEKKQQTSKETSKERQSPSPEEEDSKAVKMASYPSNYRYRNCIESYDEEDEIAFEESDIDDEDEDDFDEDEGEIDCLRTSQEDFSEKFKSLSVSRDSLGELTEEKSENPKMNGNARVRSQYVQSVLNPVENLSQWKELKAKVKPLPPLKRHRKENVGIEQQILMPEITVDASLSNWLGSKESSLEEMFPWRNREDTPILDITNLEV